MSAPADGVVNNSGLPSPHLSLGDNGKGQRTRDSGGLSEALRDPWVRKMVGAIPRPGGVQVIGKAIGWAGVERGARVVDAGCGRGSTAVFLAQNLGCEVTALAAGPQDLSAARETALREKVGHLVTLAQGDALSNSLGVATFDAALLECTLSRTARREEVLTALAVALKPGGRLVLADVAAEGALPTDAAAFIAMAGFGGVLPSLSSYVTLVEEAGLAVLRSEPEPSAVPLLLQGVTEKMAGAEFAMNLGLLPITTKVFGQLRALLGMAERLSAEGILRYVVLIAEKPRV